MIVDPACLPSEAAVETLNTGGVSMMTKSKRGATALRKAPNSLFAGVSPPVPLNPRGIQYKFWTEVALTVSFNSDFQRTTSGRPGPICNPGLAAIHAVLNPQYTDELYFVADGKGGHVFAKNLKEHNLNATKWRKIRDAN